MRAGLVTRISIWCTIIFMLAGCSAVRNRAPRQEVPIDITIETNEPQLSSVNFNLYAFKVTDRLEDFNVVDLILVDPADTPSITLNISIDRFSTFPPDQRVSRRVFRRSVPAGTDQNGRTIYQTVTAVADIVQSRIKAFATFNTHLTIKGSPGKDFKKTFSDNLNIDNVYVTNIQGDSRALDPSVYSATMPPMEPLTDDILLALSNKEMLDRLSREIRAYYSK